MIKHIKIM